MESDDALFSHLTYLVVLTSTLPCETGNPEIGS